MYTIESNKQMLQQLVTVFNEDMISATSNLYYIHTQHRHSVDKSILYEEVKEAVNDVKEVFELVWLSIGSWFEDDIPFEKHVVLYRYVAQRISDRAHELCAWQLDSGDDLRIWHFMEG